MSGQKQYDHSWLIDFLLGHHDAGTDSAIRARLDSDAEFSSMHDNLANTFSAISVIGQVEPPADLTDRTLARIKSYQQTNALLIREQLASRSGRRIFSIRDIAAVAAIVLITFGIMSVWYNHARHRKLIGSCSLQTGRIAAGFMGYAADNDGCLPAADRSASHWLGSQGCPAVSNSSGLFRLVASGYAKPSAFQCPAVENAPAVRLVVRKGMTDFPAAGYINYSYQHTLGGRGISRKRLSAVAAKMAILADSTPVFAGGRFRPDRVNARAGDNHSGSGQNVLYLDMHVEWSDGPAVGVGGNNIFLVEGITTYRGDERPVSDTDTFLLPAYCPSPKP